LFRGEGAKAIGFEEDDERLSTTGDAFWLWYCCWREFEVEEAGFDLPPSTAFGCMEVMVIGSVKGVLSMTDETQSRRSETNLVRLVNGSGVVLESVQNRRMAAPHKVG
jgi:hypothetical protein